MTKMLNMGHQRCWRLHFKAVGNTVQVKIYSPLQAWLQSACDRWRSIAGAVIYNSPCLAELNGTLCQRLKIHVSRMFGEEFAELNLQASGCKA